MIDANLLPDAVISLENTNKDKNLLLKRFCDDKALPDPSLEKKKETEKEDSQVQLLQLQYRHYTYMYSTYM